MLGNYPVKLKGLCILPCSWKPHHYAPFSIEGPANWSSIDCGLDYPMGKSALILKGSACNFAILVTDVILCSYHEGVSLWLPYTVLCSILLWYCHLVV